MHASEVAPAIAAIDDINKTDPNCEDVGGCPQPAALLYGQRMTAALERMYPEAGPALQIAVRAQHIQRWSIPRTDYAMDRVGYLRWRSDLKHHHAELTARILEDCGFEGALVARVQALVRKERIKHDDDAQAVEDVACIVFLKYYLEGFAAKHSEEKLVGILRKTWAKMSEHGRATALKLELPDGLGELLASALAGRDDVE